MRSMGVVLLSAIEEPGAWTWAKLFSGGRIVGR
jgi:hypothetical protein